MHLENLERHLAKVHPAENPTQVISEGDRLEMRRASRKRAPLHVSRPIAAGIVVGVALLVLGAWAAGVYLPRSEPEQMTHWHPTLSISINGVPQTVPPNIGIDPALYRDHSLDSHSMMSMAPLHTHDTSGQIHVEWMGSTEKATVGNFFRIWGQSFDSGQLLGHQAGPGHQVRMVVDGTPAPVSQYLLLRDGMSIAIVCDTA